MPNPAFISKTYLYPTSDDGCQTIGVCRGLTDKWIVAWANAHGSMIRVKTYLLPPTPGPVEAQRQLDIWAARRGLARA